MLDIHRNQLEPERGDAYHLCLQGDLEARYLIERTVIGSGGFSLVYRAFDMKLGIETALKVIPVGPIMAEAEILEEARSLASLSKYAIPIYDVHFVEDPNLRNTIATRFPDGSSKFGVLNMMLMNPNENLQAIIQNRTALTFPVIQSLAFQIGDALVYFRNRNVLFRDWKPGNLNYQDMQFLRFGDFGISSRVQHVQPSRFGSTGYISPERLMNHALLSFESEIYEAGQLLYAIITGESPYTFLKEDGDTEEQASLRLYLNDGLTQKIRAPLVTSLDDYGTGVQTKKKVCEFFNQVFANLPGERPSSGHAFKDAFC